MATQMEQMMVQMLQILADNSTQMKEYLRVNAEAQENRGKNNWSAPEKFKQVKVFAGKQDEWEEFSHNLLCQIGAGDGDVVDLMEEAALETSEQTLSEEDYDLMSSANLDADQIKVVSKKLYSLLAGMTTGEANAVVRRSGRNGLLAWKRLSSSLNPRTLGSGIKAISAVLNPGRVTNAAKADHAIEAWEDNLAKLAKEYGEVISAKMKVAVLYAMLPKDLQERALDKCAVSWGNASEDDAKLIFTKIREETKNVAKSRRDMATPKPMEVDEVTRKEEEETEAPEECETNYVGNTNVPKGKGKSGGCWTCGETGHRQFECPKNQNRGQNYGKGGNFQANAQRIGKGGNGHGSQGASASWQGMPRACFCCGSLNHLARNCPQNPQAATQQRVNEVVVEDDGSPEVLFVGHVEKESQWREVKGRWTRQEAREPLGPPPGLGKVPGSRFAVLAAEQDDGCGQPEESWVNLVGAQRVQVGGKGWASLGVGEIVVDSAAEESCWPVDQGGAFETKPSRRNIVLKTANGAEMRHYGEKEITIKGSSDGEVVGLKFQVTDVKRPLLAVRRLVEKGNVVMFGPEPHQTYILHVASGRRIPMERRGGTFVIKAHFVKELSSGFTRQV